MPKIINERRIALLARSASTGVSAILPAAADFVPAVIERFNQLIDDLKQSTRVRLNGCQGAELSPVFFVSRDSHAMAEAIT